MIGSNVPHLHLCNAKLNPTMGLEASAGVALQFHPTIFPMSMEKLPDYLPIYGLLQKSQYGIRFYDKNLYEELLQRFQELERVEHTARLIHFFQILERLCQCKKTNILSNVAYNSSNLLPEVNEPVMSAWALSMAPSSVLKAETYRYFHPAEIPKLFHAFLFRNFDGQRPLMCHALFPVPPDV